MRYPELFERTRQIAAITQTDWEEFSQHLVPGNAQKGEVLSRPGEEAKFIWVVTKGILRNYDLDEKGKEYTKVFRGPGGMVGSYPEILTFSPTRFFIESITNSEFLRFPYVAFTKMMDHYKSWERLGRILAERNYLEKEKREYDLMHLSAEERYDEFVKLHKDLMDQIPQYQIASNLAISPESLNRLLKARKV